MAINKTAAIAVIASALLSLTSNAHAFERWTSKDLNGKVIHGIKCDNGDRWQSGDGSIAPTDADAARICKKRGSSMTTAGDNPIGAQRAPNALTR